MNIQVNVDLSEFFSEVDEQSFSEQIKNHITYTVKNEVLAEWKEKITKEFNEQVKATIEQEKERLISNMLNELILSEKLHRSHGSKELVSIKDFAIENLKSWWLNESTTTRTFDKILQKESESIVEKLKERYDLMFASQIITKLNEAGMLKEDVAKLILGQ